MDYIFTLSSLINITQHNTQYKVFQFNRIINHLELIFCLHVYFHLLLLLLWWLYSRTSNRSNPFGLEFVLKGMRGMLKKCCHPDEDYKRLDVVFIGLKELILFGNLIWLITNVTPSCCLGTAATLIVLLARLCFCKKFMFATKLDQNPLTGSTNSFMEWYIQEIIVLFIGFTSWLIFLRQQNLPQTRTYSAIKVNGKLQGLNKAEKKSEN